MRGLLKGLGVLAAGVALGYFIAGTDLGRAAQERQAEAAGALASRYVAAQTELDERAPAQTVAGLSLIKVEVDRFQDNILRATGVANTYLVRTAQGNLLFDTGLATQAAKHKRLLQEAAPGPVTHIVLSHSHADHIGGVKFWRAEFPDAQLIAHAKFPNGQRYLKALEPHFWSRNRLLYPFMPEAPPEGGFAAYGGVQPDVLVADGATHSFTLGGVRFEALPAPGAEGEDNLVLWLPQQRALFSGDFFGPLFPMTPNLFTLRGEKFRDPTAYVASLDRLIALRPQIVLPSHFDPVLGEERLAADMQAMRDATAYIHDQTIAGMNAGKSLWTLMREIKLPPTLALSQGHGKVSWNVRSIWEHYSTWFHFESTTELYPTQVRELYPELAALSGGAGPLIDRARSRLNAGRPEQALHFIEIALAGEPQSREALQARLEALRQLLQRAFAAGGNYSETGWLKSRIRATEEALEGAA